MRATTVEQCGTEIRVVTFDPGDEVVSALTEFARREDIVAAHFTAVGALSEATLGVFEPERTAYRRVSVSERVQVLSLVGDIATDGDSPRVHAHAVLGKADTTTRGGHLLDARVWTTLELVLTPVSQRLARRTDPASGLALIDATNRRAA